MSSPAAKKSRFSPATVQLPSQPLPPSAALGSPPGTSTGISSNQNSGGNSSSRHVNMIRLLKKYLRFDTISRVLFDFVSCGNWLTIEEIKESSYLQIQ